MTTTIHQALGEFIDAWNAGRRPDVDDYLARVAPADRAAFTRHVEAWLDVAPTPAYDDAAWAAVEADPALRAALAAGELARMPVAGRVAVLRERAGLAVREVATRVVERFALGGADAEPRTAAYLEELERGELDASRLSRRLLDGLAGILGARPDALAGGWAGAVAQRGVVYQRTEDHARDVFLKEIDALSQAAMAPAPTPMDEVDRLFLGGPEG